MKNFYLRCHTPLHVAVLTAAAFAVFSNNYRHDYPLDGGHLLLENSYVRSLKFIGWRSFARQKIGAKT